MISGRRALGDIKRALKEERARLKDIDRRIDEASERALAVDAARADQLAELARVRVGEPKDTGAREHLGDARVAALLEARRATRAELEAKLDDLENRLSELDGQRDGLVDALETAMAELDVAEAATQARLERDDDYRAQRERAHAAERIARHAADKAVQSEAERSQKGRAYENDVIFMYLWRRGYGMRGYRAWPLTRRLDRKVARLISFDINRANYARLIELPVRLREHADAMAELADAELAELRRLDEVARAQDGVDGLERNRDAADEALASHDAAMGEAVRAREETFASLERMNRGEDEAYGQMVAFLAAELGREELQSLRREALATPFPEDDVIVARMLDLEADRGRLEGTVADLKQAAEGSRARVRELETLMRDFTARRYDAPGSGFPDDDMFKTILGQFLRGAVASHVLWRVLDAQRQPPARRSNPTFGSGGFGKGSPWSGGGWARTGAPGGSGGRLRPPLAGAAASGTMKRGGFTTGGRMARPTFRTGGRKR